jgi:hypothetical protein
MRASGVANLLRCLHPRILRINFADEADLRDAVRVLPAVLTDELVDTLSFSLASCIKKLPAFILNVLGSNLTYGTSALCVES